MMIKEHGGLSGEIFPNERVVTSLKGLLDTEAV